MYKVLLVDDEPLVLSGIKFLIDWNKLDCKIVQTARNGKQALEIIELERPDIVVCDINMPVLSGLELLKTVVDIPYAPLFIMLTNHQDFDMARESLRYRAVDYLVKTQLEPEALEGALKRAIVECNKRQQLAHIHLAQEVITGDRTKLIHTAMSNAIGAVTSGKPVDHNSYQILEEKHVLDSFALLEVVLDFSSLPNFHDLTMEDKEQLYVWEQELLVTLMPKIFPDALLLERAGDLRRFQIAAWQLEEATFLTKVELFYTKLLLASSNVTPIKLSLLVTDVLRGRSLDVAINQLEVLAQDYYQTEFACKTYSEIASMHYEEVKLAGLTNKLVLAIRSKNIGEVSSILEGIQQQLLGGTHEKKEVLKSCTELYSSTSAVVSSIFPEDKLLGYFTEMTEGLQQVQQLLTRGQLGKWLLYFELQITEQIQRCTSNSSELMERVKAYILEHVKEKIMLQDIADYVNVSPTYLSALFKKHTHQTLMDYINEVKMEQACELIREGTYKMYEISYLLGFENAYYFTKVFKRYIGKTPKEYQHQIKGR